MNNYWLTLYPDLVDFTGPVMRYEIPPFRHKNAQFMKRHKYVKKQIGEKNSAL